MMNYEIVELKEIHAKQLAEVAHDVFKISYEHKLEGKFEKENFKVYLKNAFAHAQMMKEIQDAKSMYCGIFEEEQLIAFFKLNFLENQTLDRPDNHVEVERFYVVPDKQGNGIGYFMLKWISDWAKHKGYVKLWLRSWERNDGGIAFYTKMGMNISGTAEYKFEESDDVDYVIEKDLV